MTIAEDFAVCAVAELARIERELCYVHSRLPCGGF